jgi:trk system potassium uptake protein TrkH
VLIGGFVMIITIGTLLLALPWAAADGHSIGLVDALFTATSAVCVTGLIVKDTPVAFSLFGELVILALIQIGGLGYAGSAMLIGVVAGRKIGLRERIIFQQAMNLLSMEGLVKFLRWLVLCTLLIEGAAAALLTLRFLQEMPPLRAAYAGIFHAVSAFNNAGFSIFSDNLMRYKLDWTVNLVIAVAIVLGGIGYIVLYDLHRYAGRAIFRIPVHVKLVLTMTPLLILAGGVGLWALEAANPKTLSVLSGADQVMVAFFHSVSARTAGFNTIDLSLLGGASLYLLILLMIIGGSPASTAGGIKTTAAGVIFATLWTIARGRQETTLFHRRLPFQVVASAFLVAFLAFAVVTGATLLLLTVERLSFERFLPALFEVASAFGTVGLSTGDGGILSYAATFSAPGKLIVTLVMFVGRLGPLTIGMAVATKADVRYRYPEERVMIG